MIDIDALFCQDKTVCVKAVDNPLQVSAHAYSQNVLLGEKDEKLNKKTTPKFERAKLYGRKIMGLFISPVLLPSEVNKVWKEWGLKNKHLQHWRI